MTDTEIWNEPGEDALLSATGAHVWSLRFDRPAADAGRLNALLSEDEIERAGRFRFDDLKRRYILSRACLRILIGRYLAADPSTLRFKYGPNGKPMAAADWAQSGIQFNMSHSNSFALYAVTRAGRVGIDVEDTGRAMSDLDAIAQRFFSPRESDALRKIPAGRRREAFFNCWTRKEAFIKAIGEGLSMPLDRFEVSLSPFEPARLISILGDDAAAARWRILHLEPARNHIGAVAVEAPDCAVDCRRVPDAYLNLP